MAPEVFERLETVRLVLCVSFLLGQGPQLFSRFVEVCGPVKVETPEV